MMLPLLHFSGDCRWPPIVGVGNLFGSDADAWLWFLSWEAALFVLVVREHLLGNPLSQSMVGMCRSCVSLSRHYKGCQNQPYSHIVRNNLAVSLNHVLHDQTLRHWAAKA